MIRELNPVLWLPRGVGWRGRWVGGGEGKGTFLYLWLIHVDVQQKPTQYCKVIILQFKKKREYSWFHHAEETTGNTLKYIFSLFLCRNIFIFLKSTVVTSVCFFNLLFYPIIYFEHHLKLIHFWASLVVHWLRLQAPNAGGLGWTKDNKHRKKKRSTEQLSCYWLYFTILGTEECSHYSLSSVAYESF